MNSLHFILLLFFAQEQLPAPKPAFRLAPSADFLQPGAAVSTIAWRGDGEGGLDITQTPCEGRYVLSFTERKPTPFNLNSVHTLLHRVEMFGYAFESDNLDPLVFRVDAEGYTWVRGKGNVTIPADARAPQLRGVTAIPDQRTYLLPPGRTTADLAPPPPAASAPAVCGRQIRVVSLTRQQQSLLLRLGSGTFAWPAASSNRVMLALIDDKGTRYKPREEIVVNWGNLTQPMGIPFDVPASATPVLLEIEGVLLDIRSIAIKSMTE